MNRRGFLSGIAAGALAAVVPLPKVVASKYWRLPELTATIVNPWTRHQAKMLTYAANYGAPMSMKIMEKVEVPDGNDFYQDLADKLNEDGHGMIITDLSSIEARIMAWSDPTALDSEHRPADSAS